MSVSYTMMGGHIPRTYSPSADALYQAPNVCHRGPAHGDIFRIFPSGSSHVRGQQCTVAIEEKRFSHRGAATQAYSKLFA